MIYFPCVFVSLDQCELQSLGFPSASSALQLSFLIFFFFCFSLKIFSPPEQLPLYEKMGGKKIKALNESGYKITIKY